MTNFRKFNLIFGWLSFAIASLVYILTIEPTTSFWDCGEFITSAYKLQVGHPPGAPFFMIVGRFFTLFATDATQVALSMNLVSAFSSSFTILFLFWSVTHIAKRIVVPEGDAPTRSQLIAIMASGFVGAMVYTFSDTFWFSAVEAEVYAMSSLFTAVVFWAILKWENEPNAAYANRWLILITYLMGLSIGVHLLNLLAIPAIVFIYYFKNYQVTKAGIVKAAVSAVVILGVVQYGIIPGVVWGASRFELLFTNGLGLPFNTGSIIYALLLVGGIVYGLYYTLKNNKVLANTILLAFTVILIGYSSFTIIVIRSLADTPMNQNAPQDVFGLLSYLNREQYGDRPLIFGQSFNAELDNNNPYSEGKATYVKDEKKGEYVIVDRKTIQNFQPKYITFFPRMYSDQPSHAEGYKRWSGMKTDIKPPTFGENLTYFFRYQVNYMYWRYFLWNFSGRQNDIQGHGEVNKGNWLSGIALIDNARLGNQDKLPAYLKNNKGRNVYYMLPLLLGLIGALFLLMQKGVARNYFWVLLMFFFFTGLAIVLYVNQPPFQPRERDYSYAGSFYVFAMFIGLGVLALYESFRKYTSPLAVATAVAVLTTLIPVQMMQQNWDDHDRSGRYTARDFAYNYLNSCEPNAILFTNGDNDTFPLWYAQEVEGIRTDVRVVNLSYLNTDWYISQMKKKAYDSNPVPFSTTPEQYKLGSLEVARIEELIKKPISLKDAIDFVKSSDPRTKDPRSGYDILPGKKLVIPAGKIALKAVHPQDTALVNDVAWLLDKPYIRKAEIMTLDLLANNNWQRPVYFAITVGSSNYLQLENYFQLDGMAYKVVPIQSESKYGFYGRVNTDILYEKLMNTFKWGGVDKGVYVDENNQRMLMNIKNNFLRLSEQLVAEEKFDKAEKALDYCYEVVDENVVEFGYYDLLMADVYLRMGKKEKAERIFDILSQNLYEEMNYYASLNAKQAATIKEDADRTKAIAYALLSSLEEQNQTDLLQKYQQKFSGGMLF